MPDPQDAGCVEHLTPEEASRIIHSHRKVRYGTACWPCRQRKVKCDNKSPCENCVKREHPQLCSYRPNRTAASTTAVSVQHAQGQKRSHSPDDVDSETRETQRRSPRSLSTEPTSRAYESDLAETRYLGQNSIPALLREQGSPATQTPGREGEGVDTIRQDMRSIFGLDDSAPFPLMSSRHLDRLTQDISSELPSDRDVMKLFRTYKEIPQPFWGFVVDIADLESKLMVYLEERAKNAHASTKTTRPVSPSWLAVLFAVLAVGSQYHDSPYHVRTRDSQRYIQISFHFLRVGNFLIRPNFDSIQALLMTSFVLLNDMKAEASWALLGLTCRLAQSLGIHLEQTSDSRDVTNLKKRDLARRRLWWTCVWHDTLSSLSFDRPPMTNISCCSIPVLPVAEKAGWTYTEAMYHLCDMISRRLNPDAVARASYARILDNCHEVEAVRDRLAPQLRHKQQCRSAVDRLQYFAIRLHTSFVVSVCCRPALRRSNPKDGPNALTAQQRRTLAEKCKDNLTETVRMFLAMHQLSVIPTRSWAFTYHGLSSAVLLGILGETNADPEVRQLQGDLIAALSAAAAKEAQQPSPAPHIQKTDRDIELSGPLSRALMALRNIYDHGSIVGTVKLEVANGGSGSSVVGHGSLPGSGARTPLAGGGGGGANTPQLGGSARGAAAGGGGGGGGGGPVAAQGLAPMGPGQQQLDPHHNAALAMAEMQAQTGTGMQEFSGLSYGAQPTLHQVEMLSSDFQAADPAAYMSPMDLYDHIFWDVPDPYQPGVDAMNFDFLAHPPPGQPPQRQFYF